LIHRDIKPANIYLCRIGLEYDFAKVLDFGLVKSERRDEATTVTASGSNRHAGIHGSRGHSGPCLHRSQG